MVYSTKNLSIQEGAVHNMKEEKKERSDSLLFFHVNGPFLYRKVFRAIHHVEKDQPPMYLTIFFPRKGVLLMMLITAVRSEMGKLGLG